ncbi:MAG: hypothetical protein ACRETH_13330, partial [Steroidobacteraceae bacterium]
MNAWNGASARRWLLVLGVLAAGLVSASDGNPQADAEQYIKVQEAAWAESVATNDASVVRRILADDCIWVLDGE